MRHELDLASRIRAANKLRCALIVHSSSEERGLRLVARRFHLPMPKIVYRDLPERTSDAAA
ncbi:hypothetical protein [Ruegeria arenilitoris]|uniref:hypothetical protein n=1 Tax=Ruegeria arenilitoris TaxID=1173585 RepID=UPI001481B572|nr:hypothetical protein [Ruegeria arenilitoris]